MKRIIKRMLRRLLYMTMFLLAMYICVSMWFHPSVRLLRTCGLPIQSLLHVRLADTYECLGWSGDGARVYLFQTDEGLYELLDECAAADERFHKLPMAADYKYLEFGEGKRILTDELRLPSTVLSSIRHASDGYWFYINNYAEKFGKEHEPDWHVDYTVCVFHRGENICIYYTFSV